MIFFTNFYELLPLTVELDFKVNGETWKRKKRAEENPRRGEDKCPIRRSCFYTERSRWQVPRCMYSPDQEGTKGSHRSYPWPRDSVNVVYTQVLTSTT